MNENLDLTKILKGCPERTKLYSPLFGEVEFLRVDNGCDQPIIIEIQTKALEFFSKDGCYFNYEGAECLLFPSKNQRDWSKFERFWDKPKVERFDMNTLQPFDKVLVRDYSTKNWGADFFLKLREERDYVYCILNSAWKYCIPYNEETKHLIGTNNDCPDYYKWWEEQL